LWGADLVSMPSRAFFVFLPPQFRQFLNPLPRHCPLYRAF
jgi:hypothetical protein